MPEQPIAVEVPEIPSALPADEAQRLVRLIDRMFGRGFKLAFIETQTVRDRDDVIEWLSVLIGMHAGKLVRIDARRLNPSNLWHSLHGLVADHGNSGPTVMLALTDLEEVIYRDGDHRHRLVEQLNVQRDSLVRDFPCFWVVFSHPRSRQLLQRIAPDFCDFASLWIQVEPATEKVGLDKRWSDEGGTYSSRLYRGPSLGDPLLDQALEALELWQPAKAQDLLSQFDLGARSQDLALRLTRAILAASLLHAQGKTSQGIKLLLAAVDVEKNNRQTSLEQLAFARQALGEMYLRSGELDEAERLLRESMELFSRLGLPWCQADASTSLADVLMARGDHDSALDLLKKAVQSFESLSDERSRALALCRVADILTLRGDVETALQIHREQQLPVYAASGDVRSYAVTMGRIADILESRGDLDEALRIRREEELPVYEQLGDERLRAVTLGQIADVLESRGHLDEALRIRREEELPVYERLGDVRSWAMTKGQIADAMQALGDVDEAMRIRRDEVLPTYERLGAVRSRAVTLGKIADVLQARGDLDEALRIRREEELPVYERLGDVRSRGTALGKIASILASRGELDEAIRLREEEYRIDAQLDGEVDLVFDRMNLASLLLRRDDEGDKERAKQLLQDGWKAAERIQLPEAKKIAHRLMALDADG